MADGVGGTRVKKSDLEARMTELVACFDALVAEYDDDSFSSFRESDISLGIMLGVIRRTYFTISPNVWSRKIALLPDEFDLLSHTKAASIKESLERFADSCKTFSEAIARAREPAHIKKMAARSEAAKACASQTLESQYTDYYTAFMDSQDQDRTSFPENLRKKVGLDELVTSVRRFIQSQGQETKTKASVETLGSYCEQYYKKTGAIKAYLKAVQRKAQSLEALTTLLASEPFKHAKYVSTEILGVSNFGTGIEKLNHHHAMTDSILQDDMARHTLEELSLMYQGQTTTLDAQCEVLTKSINDIDAQVSRLFDDHCVTIQDSKTAFDIHYATFMRDVEDTGDAAVIPVFDKSPGLKMGMTRSGDGEDTGDAAVFDKSTGLKEEMTRSDDHEGADFCRDGGTYHALMQAGFTMDLPLFKEMQNEFRKESDEEIVFNPADPVGTFHHLKEKQRRLAEYDTKLLLAIRNLRRDLSDQVVAKMGEVATGIAGIMAGFKDGLNGVQLHDTELEYYLSLQNAAERIPRAIPGSTLTGLNEQYRKSLDLLNDFEQAQKDFQPIYQRHRAVVGLKASKFAGFVDEINRLIRPIPIPVTALFDLGSSRSSSEPQPEDHIRLLIKTIFAHCPPGSDPAKEFFKHLAANGHHLVVEAYGIIRTCLQEQSQAYSEDVEYFFSILDFMDALRNHERAIPCWHFFEPATYPSLKTRIDAVKHLEDWGLWLMQGDELTVAQAKPVILLDDLKNLAFAQAICIAHDEGMGFPEVDKAFIELLKTEASLFIVQLHEKNPAAAKAYLQAWAAAPEKPVISMARFNADSIAAISTAFENEVLFPLGHPEWAASFNEGVAPFIKRLQRLGQPAVGELDFGIPQELDPFLSIPANFKSILQYIPQLNPTLLLGAVMVARQAEEMGIRGVTAPLLVFLHESVTAANASKSSNHRLPDLEALFAPHYAPRLESNMRFLTILLRDIVQSQWVLSNIFLGYYFQNREQYHFSYHAPLLATAPYAEALNLLIRINTEDPSEEVLTESEELLGAVPLAERRGGNQLLQSLATAMKHIAEFTWNWEQDNQNNTEVTLGYMKDFRYGAMKVLLQHKEPHEKIQELHALAKTTFKCDKALRAVKDFLTWLCPLIGVGYTIYRTCYRNKTFFRCQAAQTAVFERISDQIDNAVAYDIGIAASA